MRRTPAALSLPVLATLVLLLGGCGDDDSGGDEGSSSESNSTSESTSTSAASSTSAVELGVIQTYEDLSADHAPVGRTIRYDQVPPVGGRHWEAWQDCGIYDAPVRTEAALHSMEHGAVWITYRPSLPADQVDQIRALAQQEYMLVSPWEDESLPAPIVFTAWGAQLLLDSLPNPTADEFVATYRDSPDGPEPGAPCSDGIADTAAELEEQLG